MGAVCVYLRMCACACVCMCSRHNVPSVGLHAIGYQSVSQLRAFGTLLKRTAFTANNTRCLAVNLRSFSCFRLRLFCYYNFVYQCRIYLRFGSCELKHTKSKINRRTKTTTKHIPINRRLMESGRRTCSETDLCVPSFPVAGKH